ncbi:hypothetical protein D3C78_1904370 [compost metagenome]
MCNDPARGCLKVEDIGGMSETLLKPDKLALALIYQNLAAALTVISNRGKTE